MILDYDYIKERKLFTLSYIKDDGNKEILNFNNLNKFKTYYHTPTGKYTDWQGASCDICYTQQPNKFDLKEFINELPNDIQDKLNKRTFPKLYTFDIETRIRDKFTFVSPLDATEEVLTISFVSPNMNAVVLGTKPLNESEIEYVRNEFYKYIHANPFYQELYKDYNPVYKYIYFKSEEDMLRFFLEKCVAKVPVLAGWNSILYDWCYITNRIKNFYPKLSMKLSSITNCVRNKRYEDRIGNEVKLPMPLHTLVIDMMDVIEKEDHVVMPMKESMNLDFIAHESIGANKITYSGSLQDLYDSDYKQYVFYNLIDSILVQLIDKKFKTMDHIYMQSLYCKEKIGSCFSKIALTEALIVKDFKEHNIKIVYDKQEGIDRGKLIGAYVKLPRGGRYSFISCNDYASLYPSTMITCNLSFDNFVGYFYDNQKIKSYTDKGYLAVGPVIFENKGTADKPEAGNQIDICLDEDSLRPYREDKNYFVSVNGHVYKNDKQYTIPRIEQTLYNERKVSKYLAKKLEAQVILDLEHLRKGITDKFHTYDSDMVNCMNTLGYTVKSGDDLLNIKDLDEFEFKLRDEIEYNTNLEQAIKLLMNSIYGGSSHISFYWFNLSLARDITAEARNNTMMMEDHLRNYWKTAWTTEPKLKNIQNELGITLKSDSEIKSIIDNSYDKSLVEIVYGDTDSLYISYENLLETIKDIDKLSIQEKLNILLKINLDFLDQHNNEFISEYYSKRHAIVPGFNKFELETVALRGVWLRETKKKYGQILLYKDGKYFDVDSLPMKFKGLEVVKANYPTLARKQLKDLIRFLLEYNGKYLVQELNKKSFEFAKEWKDSSHNIEDLCENVKCSKYAEYIINDKETLEFGKGTPATCKALALRNHLNYKYKFGEKPLYGGKIKMYTTMSGQVFGFESNEYPVWATKYAPIDGKAMYEKYVLASLNRILVAIGFNAINYDGSISLELF